MRFQRNKPKQARLEITPLIDVVLLLLIFFMISTTFIKPSEIAVSLPAASTEKQIQESPLEVVITKVGLIYINDKAIPITKLKSKLTLLTQKSPAASLVIKADGQVKHQTVVDVMDISKQAGISKLSIATVPKEY